MAKYKNYKEYMEDYYLGVIMEQLESYIACIEGELFRGYEGLDMQP